MVNAIRGLGGKLKEKEVVSKILRTLPMRYDSKVSTLEERDDLKTMTVDELHGILIAYEMRIDKENPSKREANFKASKKTKCNKKEAINILYKEFDG